MDHSGELNDPSFIVHSETAKVFEGFEATSAMAWMLANDQIVGVIVLLVQVEGCMRPVFP